MAHFAKVENGTVTQVIVAEQDFIDSGAVGSATDWVQTSYNTYGGAHKTGGTPLRKNYAGIGYTYDKTKDAFIPPKPFASWLLNNTTCLWESPVPYPTDVGTDEEPKFYTWDEATVNWKLVEPAV
jgi:hypothetical protein